MLASGLQKSWSAVRAKQLVPAPLVGWQRVFSFRVNAEGRQNRSKFIPPTYSYGSKSRDFTSVPRSVAMKNTHTGGLQ